MSDTPRTDKAETAFDYWANKDFEASFRGSHLDSDDPEPLDGFEIARQLERELNEATRWRPIENAPKDGTAVLALLPNSDMPVVVRWDTRWAACWDECPLSGLDTPTHWMPLPKPPTL